MSVPWSQYLQKSCSYNSFLNSREPVNVVLSSVKNGLPKVQTLVFQSLLNADPRIILFSGATRNPELMSVIKSSNSTHVIYWEMPKTKETYILTGRIYIVAAPALSYRFGTPPRRINVESTQSAEEYWEDERIRIWQKLTPEYRATFTWPETGRPSTNVIGNGELSWSVYQTQTTIKVPAASNLDTGYKYKRLEAIKETSLHKSGSIVTSASSPTITSNNNRLFGGMVGNGSSELETVHNVALDNFCLLVFKVTHVDYLQHGLVPPKRILFSSSKNGNEWTSEELNDGDENDVEVTWEDQQNINKFSTLNIKLENTEAEYEKIKKEKEYMDDLQQEIEQLELLAEDEDEKVKYRVGDAFVELSIPECQELIEKKVDEYDNQLDDFQTKISEINEQMAKLKAILYGKFGKSINLEKD